MNTANEFLTELYDGLDDGLRVNLVAIKDSEVSGIAPTLAEVRDTDCVQEFIDKYQADERNIYFLPNLLAREPKHGRAATDDLADPMFAFADFDPPKVADISQWREEERKRLRDLNQSVLLDSGNGFQRLFRLSRAVTVERIKEINQIIQARSKSDPAATAACHPYRLPFTVNYPNATKRQLGRVPAPATVIEMKTVTFDPDGFTAPKEDRFFDLDPDIRHIIATATRPQGEDGAQFAGRSEARMSVMLRMFSRKLSRERVEEVISDPSTAIAPSETRKMTRTWISKEVERGYAAFQKSIPPYVGRFNEKYFVTMFEGKAVVVEEVYDAEVRRHKFQFINKESLNLFYANDRVRIGNQNIPKSSLWLTHEHRRTHSTMILNPTLPPGGSVDGPYNMWRGWPVQAASGDCSYFEELVNEVICDGDANASRYLWGWLARGIQKPDLRAEVAIVMRGGRGTGKGTLASTYGELFGGHFFHITNQQHLTGAFNAHFMDCLCLFADEAMWAGSKKAESVLKGLITERLLPIEKKFMDATNMPNRLKIIMASNADWVVPAGLDERRFFVTDVSDKHQKDLEWFGKLHAQLDAGGRAALLYKLMNYDLSGFEVRQPPVTKALHDQQDRSMGAFEAWWYDELFEGDHGIAEQSSEDEEFRWEIVPRDLIYDRYMDFRREYDRFGDAPKSKNAFGKALAKMLPERFLSEYGLKQGPRRMYMGKKVNTYVLPELEECRAAFEVVMKREFAWSVDDRYRVQARVA